jgi:hypothetical protein
MLFDGQSLAGGGEQARERALEVIGGHEGEFWIRQERRAEPGD